MTTVRAELHCHSTYSADCLLSLETIIDLCLVKKIDVIALTDHNEIKGAQRLKSIAPKWLKVIIGEEIATAQGDVIGLFLTKRIEAKQPIGDTIHQIKAQGGLVLLPHPFDRVRREAVGEAIIDQVRTEIDFLEIYNARTLLQNDNLLAQEYANRYNLATFVGSDAHLATEYGRATCQMSPFSSPSEFVASLKRATFVSRRSSPFVHVATKATKLIKKIYHD